MKYSKFREIEVLAYSQWEGYCGNESIDMLRKPRKLKEYGLLEENRTTFSKSELKKIYKFINQLILGLKTPTIVIIYKRITKKGVDKIKKKIVKNKFLLEGLLAFINNNLNVYDKPDLNYENLSAGMQLNFDSRLLNFYYIDTTDKDILTDLEKFI